MMRGPRQFFVYIMTNGPKSAVLYTGITGDLRRRVWQHKNNRTPGFTSRYHLHQLVYYEKASCIPTPPSAAKRKSKGGGEARRSLSSSP
jgi:predicted GIY-YIG superfamily endonuclease